MTMRADGLVGSGSENSPERERESGARAHDAAVYAHGPPVAPVVGSGVDDSDAWSVGILGFGSEHGCGAAGGGPAAADPPPAQKIRTVWVGLGHAQPGVCLDLPYMGRC
jgi:hypothetical protein